MSTPFFCLGFSKKKKTRYKTQNATLCDAVYRRRRNEKSGLSNSIPRARERGGVSRAFSRRRRRRRNPSSCPVLFFSSCQSRFVEHKKGARNRFVCPSSLVVHRAKRRALECLRRSRSRWRDRSRKESFARGRRRRRRRRLFLFVRARPFPGTTRVKKAPPRTKKGVEIWVGSLTKNIFKKITKNS